MTTTPHIEESLLQDYLDGILSQAAVEEIADHVFSCEICEQKLLSLAPAETPTWDIPQFQQKLAEAGWQKKNNSASIVLPRWTKWAIAASVTILVLIAGYWLLRQPVSLDVSEMAQNSSVKIESIQKVAGDNDDWQHAYVDGNWSLVVELLQPRADRLVQQPDSLSESEALELLAIGHALIKKENGALASNLYLEAVEANAPRVSQKNIASFYLGLMALANGDQQAAWRYWEPIEELPTLNTNFKTEIRRLRAAARASWSGNPSD